ncbi:MAG: hypothetical protein KAJ42_12430 [Gemmatimonadetes bacterium]|nr:hypothetical protein [Gemmatimonadota bacterium]
MAAGRRLVVAWPMVMLYRAAERAVAGQGASFTPDLSVAIAYTDNPGFGGPDVYAYAVEAREVLDLHNDSYALQHLAEALRPGDIEAVWDLVDEWTGSGLDSVYKILEERPEVAEDLADKQYDWISYDDDFPNREPVAAETWVKLSPGRMVGRVIWSRPHERGQGRKRRLMR